MPNAPLRSSRRMTSHLPVSLLLFGVLAAPGNAPVVAEPQATATGSPSTDLPAPIPLRLQETTQLDSRAPNASRTGTKCDADGDVFIQFGNYDFEREQFQLASAISEVIPESKRIVAHRIPALCASDCPNPRVVSFSVLPNGVVYALISTRRNASDGEPEPAKNKSEYYVEQLKEDITTDSMTHLQAPPGAAHWSAHLLGAFLKGNFLIAGLSTEEAGRPGPGSWRPFTAIYDSSGRFLVELTLPEDVVNNFSEYAGSANGTAAAGAPPARGSSDHAAAPAQSRQPPKPHEFLGVSIRSGGVVSGPDGNLWILRVSDPLRLYAVDAAGQVVKHFQFSPPVAGMTPSEFGFAGPEQMFFDFDHVATDSSPYSGPSAIIGVFDMVSEQFNALYTLPSTETGAGFFGCGDGHGGFIYLGHTPDNHLALFDFRQ
jgi:hypothetical protein